MDNKAERREDLMKNHGDENRGVREALERQTSDGARVNIVGTLNALAKLHGAKEAPWTAAIGMIREMQKQAARSPSAHKHAAFQRSESFDRLFPR